MDFREMRARAIWEGLAAAVAAALIVTGLLIATTGCGRPDATQPQGAGRQEVRMPFRRGSESRSVLADYGELVVRVGGTEEGEVPQKNRPWSSYFFPVKDPLLFGDSQGAVISDSPLGKYDLYSRKRDAGGAKQAAAWEKSAWERGGRDAQGWEGLCNAWAFASLLGPAPLAPRTLLGVTFSVGDQKALLLKTYETSVVERHYGTNFEPGPDADWNRIYPEEFHRLIQVELYQGRRPFIMDADPTPEIWNYPVWYGRSEINADASDPLRVHVVTQLVAAGMLERRLRDSTESPVHPFEYTYDLIGNPRGDGTLEVVYGEWTGDSLRKSHPNYLIPLPQRLVRGSANPEIDPALVDEILGNPR